MGSVCHGYMCILLYMKLMQCSGFPEIYVQWEQGVGSLCHEYMCILLYVNLMWCSSFPEIYAQLDRGMLALGIWPFHICERDLM